MLDAKNVVILTGGLVADPDVVGNGIVKLRLGVDWAASSKVDDIKSGFFDAVYYTNTDSPNAKFIAAQVKEDKLKKGSQVQLIGRLSQDRWETDGKKQSRVVIVVENLTYAGFSGTPKADGEEAPQAKTAVPDQF